MLCLTNLRTRSTTTRDRNLQISGRRLHWRLSTGFFAFSPGSLCNLVRLAPQNLEKVAKNPVEKIASNPVTSVAVMVFSVPDKPLTNLGPSLLFFKATFLAGALYREFREFMRILTTFLGKNTQKSIIISTNGRNTRIMMDFCGFFQGKSSEFA